MTSFDRGVLRDLVKKSLNAVGLDVIRLEPVGKSQPRKAPERSWKERLERAKILGFSPRTILDGGAFKGLWSKQVASLFPGAQLILVEPNPVVQETIRHNVSGILPTPVILNFALGEFSTHARLNIWGQAEADPGASLLAHVSGPAAHSVEVQVETLDNIAQQLSLAPDLLKLDLQGGELAALAGGSDVLKHAEMAIIEFGCLEAYVNRTTPRQLLDVMYDNNYCLYDVAGFHDRPYDGALTGGDFFFVKNSSPLRRHKAWA